MSPNTLGVLLLICLVAFAEVRSHKRAKKFRREVLKIAAPSGMK